MEYNSFLLLVLTLLFWTPFSVKKNEARKDPAVTSIHKTLRTKI